MCYINTHLAAKRAKFMARNENYHTVLKKVLFDTGGTNAAHSTTAPTSCKRRIAITNVERRRIVHAQRRDSLAVDYGGGDIKSAGVQPPKLPSRVMDSDVCLWAGDLNYRLEPLCPTTRDAIDELGRTLNAAHLHAGQGRQEVMAARESAAQAVVKAHEDTGDHRRASSAILSLGAFEGFHVNEDEELEDGSGSGGVANDDARTGSSKAGAIRSVAAQVRPLKHLYTLLTCTHTHTHTHITFTLPSTRGHCAQRQHDFEVARAKAAAEADAKKKKKAKLSKRGGSYSDGLSHLVGPAEESDHIFRCIGRGVRAADGTPVLLLRDQVRA